MDPVPTRALLGYAESPRSGLPPCPGIPEFDAVVAGAGLRQLKEPKIWARSIPVPQRRTLASRWRATNTRSQLDPTARFCCRTTTSLNRWRNGTASVFPSASPTPKGVAPSVGSKLRAMSAPTRRRHCFSHKPAPTWWHDSLRWPESVAAPTRGVTRGFAIKFYTTEGNYDMVGNNTPVFFIRDPMKFQHFIRSQKRRADSNLRDHDMQWDFWTLSPESAHQVAYLMGDRGIPRTWRHMNGYSSHTYMWINASGEKFWVKYHFISDQGVECLTQEEADALVSADTDFHTRDLFEAIRQGNYPSWTLKVQIMPFEEAKTYRFNPFDLTKVWRHADYPLVEVGQMNLDRNPTDHHSEIEQLAVEPSNMVPGIGPSPDKMLLGRMFSYPDAHRYRIGANYNQLPVNAPISPLHSYSKDGAMRYNKVSDPVYAPNSKGGPAADSARYGEPAGWQTDGQMVHAAYTLHAEDDDWGQARTLVREVFDDGERDRLVANIVGHLLDGVTEPVLQRAFEYWRNVDEDLGLQVEKGVDAGPL